MGGLYPASSPFSDQCHSHHYCLPPLTDVSAPSPEILWLIYLPHGFFSTERATKLSSSFWYFNIRLADMRYALRCTNTQRLARSVSVVKMVKGCLSFTVWKCWLNMKPFYLNFHLKLWKLYVCLPYQLSSLLKFFFSCSTCRIRKIMKKKLLFCVKTFRIFNQLLLKQFPRFLMSLFLP